MSAFTDAVDDFVTAWNAAWTASPPDKDDIAALGALLETAQLAMTFLDLADTPDAYTGKAGYLVVVNDTEDGLTFVAPS